ncbi:hypothetical protein [Paenibacillus elgii]|uniref:hypothetical protein n=1 Tax=Paenibacillus elgii TaxID=189691 RepID=UPI00203C542D|nr:hypothetical protein [Paenibacillus elgii]MCM3271138.1 hypothetical protein [Paenibacillus elgii]
MDKSTLAKLILTPEQRHAFFEGANNAVEDYEKFRNLYSDSATDKSFSSFFYDRLNTRVKQAINKKPHMMISVESKRAWFHPYHIYRDIRRNILILLLPLSSKKYIFDPSRYRKDISIGNILRIEQEGLDKALFKGKTISHQGMIPLGSIEPFGLVVTFDIKAKTMNEGALLPNQKDWIFKLENTQKYLEGLTFDNVIPLNTDSESISGHRIKEEAFKDDEVDIPLKLKDDPTS